MTERKYTRRELGRLGLIGAGAVLAGTRSLLPRTARAESHDPITAHEANKPIISAVQYVEKSTTEGQMCSGCILYTAGEGGRGKCGLFQQGTVAAEGWCTSWAAKPA
jgi:hypothetical protein